MAVESYMFNFSLMFRVVFFVRAFIGKVCLRRCWRLFCTFCIIGGSVLPIASHGATDVNAVTTPVVEVVKGEVLSRSYFFSEANREQTYALYVPHSYDAAKKAPLIVLLHGLRSNPNQIMRYQGVIPEAEKRGYVLVAPYGYNERGWYGSRGKGKEGRGFGKDSDPDNLGELSEMDVMNVLSIVQAELSIDLERTFLLGHSMGGGGALHLAATYPERWAGLACLAPSFQGSFSQLKKLKHLPVLVVTGDRDRLVRVREVRRWVDEMTRIKIDVQYNEIKGGGHFMAIIRNPEMISEVYEFFDSYTANRPISLVEAQ